MNEINAVSDWISTIVCLAIAAGCFWFALKLIWEIKRAPRIDDDSPNERPKNAQNMHKRGVW
ncbi:MAG: hypothetical protein J7619_23045 [Dyadobacter sp.]|uniref:hypothetical protein n=1 Tax=Dyadobacter sp. TaxID=1914288 RepID=UPI001B06C278|nr:hypothetical protein [Dyadobacter sp.]MBO9615592.1 hypothetical protein [Dyadobacter sp.]